MTDPQWYLEAQRDHAEWAADVDACVAWLTSPESQDQRSDATYIMVAAMSAFALHLHRVGGDGVVTYRYELLPGALVVVGPPGVEAPATLEDARARLAVAGEEIERLRAEAYPRIGSVWRHFKGGTYRVRRIFAVDNDEPLVWYVDADEAPWVRPLAEWREHIERGGYSGPRFVEVTRG